MLVTLTLSEPHEIRTIENSVEEKIGIEKIGQSDINLAALPPPFVAFCHFCHELLSPS